MASRTSRRSVEDEIFWREEKEPSFMHAPRPRVALLENPAFDPRVCTTCSEPARDCTCCKFCNEPAVAVRLCVAHHRDEVERTREESDTSALYVLAQLHMEGVL